MSWQPNWLMGFASLPLAKPFFIGEIDKCGADEANDVAVARKSCIKKPGLTGLFACVDCLAIQRAQSFFVDFADGGLWQHVDELDLIWQLEIRQA